MEIKWQPDQYLIYKKYSVFSFIKTFLTISFLKKLNRVIYSPIKNFTILRKMSTTISNIQMSVPNIPSSYLSPAGQILRENLTKEVDNLHIVFMEQDEIRDKVYKLTKKVSNLHAKTLFDIMSGQFEFVDDYMSNMRTLITEALRTIQNNNDNTTTITNMTLREANLSHTIEDFTTIVI